MIRRRRKRVEWGRLEEIGLREETGLEAELLPGIWEQEIGTELLAGIGAVEGERSGRGEAAGDITVLEMPLIRVGEAVIGEEEEQAGLDSDEGQKNWLRWVREVVCEEELEDDKEEYG